MTDKKAVISGANNLPRGERTYAKPEVITEVQGESPALNGGDESDGMATTTGINPP